MYIIYMPYTCNSCNYTTSNKYNFNSHTKTKKHIRNTSHLASHTDNVDKDVVYDICVYCNKYKHPKSMQRHIKTCNMKEMYRIKQKIKEKDTYINELQKKSDMLQAKTDKLEEKAKKYKKEIDNIKKMNQEYIKLLITSMQKPQIINKNCVNIDNVNNTVNITHNSNIGDIIQHCTDAPNIEDIVSSPLTDKEKETIDKHGVIYGALEYLLGRCIDNVDIDKRPFHCTDPSRNMYITKHTDKWLRDPRGEIIENHMKRPILNYIFENTIPTTDYDEMCKRFEEIIDIQNNYSRKVLNPNKGKVLAKNNISNISNIDNI